MALQGIVGKRNTKSANMTKQSDRVGGGTFVGSERLEDRGNKRCHVEKNRITRTWLSLGEGQYKLSHVYDSILKAI